MGDEFISWDDNLSIGIRSMDDEHKKLVKIINNLHSAMKERRGKDVMGKTLSELANYTETHFTKEEALLEQHGFSGLKKQQEEHEAFIDKILELKMRFSDGNIVTMSTMNFLKNWITEHILRCDKEYAIFLNKKGIK